MINVVRSFLKAVNSRSLSSLSSGTSSLSLQQSQEIQFDTKRPREVWIENLTNENVEGIMKLHPKIFATTPRLDIIHLNVEWQRKYRFVSFAHTKQTFECRGKFS